MVAPLFVVDAFTEQPFTGNPAGVCLLERPGDVASMQRLAAELGYAETAFVELGGSSDEPLPLRWFSPTVEVDLCGHATLATAHVLIESGRVGGGALRFATRSGTLEVRGTAGRLAMDLPLLTPLPRRASEVAAEAGRAPEALAGCAVVALAEGSGSGPVDLVVEAPDAEAVRRAVPDLATLARRRWRALLLTAPAERDADYVVRVFGPAVGIPEDPATGSAHCVLGPYWRHKLATTRFEVRQLSRRGGHCFVEVHEDRVTVSGSAVTVTEGRCLVL